MCNQATDLIGSSNRQPPRYAVVSFPVGPRVVYPLRHRTPLPHPLQNRLGVPLQSSSILPCYQSHCYRGILSPPLSHHGIHWSDRIVRENLCDVGLLNRFRGVAGLPLFVG